MSNESILTIQNSSGRQIVSIDHTGNVTLGPGIMLDEASQLFWHHVSKIASRTIKEAEQRGAMAEREACLLLAKQIAMREEDSSLPADDAYYALRVAEEIEKRGK